jgi:hypothetical protein
MKSVQQSTTTTSIPFMKEFLNYNRIINPEDVTLEIGEQIFKKYRKYFELSARHQAERIIEELCKSLAKTQYSFSAELSVKDVESLSFYTINSKVVYLSLSTSSKRLG